MRRIDAFSAVTGCVVLLLVLTGCFASGNKENRYSALMTQKLVSFTDCADAFSDSLEKIAGSKSAPSDAQIAEARHALDKLDKACADLAGQDAPSRYAAAQQAFDDAMNDYSGAIKKCRALLDFYSGYDELYRQFSDPAKGRAEIEKRERAVYLEFAQAMQKATESFRAACEKFDKVK